MSSNLNLRYSKYPVRPERRCGTSSCGCGSQGEVPVSQQIPGIAYKNGRPYDCKCNLISAPYSMPYDAKGCKQCQPPYQAVCAHKSANCKCHTRATMQNNNFYEAFNFPGKWN